MLHVPCVTCSLQPFLDDAAFVLALLLFIQLLGSVLAAAEIKRACADVKLNAYILFITAALGHRSPPLQIPPAVAALSLELCSPSAFGAPRRTLETSLCRVLQQRLELPDIKSGDQHRLGSRRLRDLRIYAVMSWSLQLSSTC